jgi:hypothetical protein
MNHLRNQYEVGSNAGFLLGLSFDLEDEGDLDSGRLSTDYTALYSGR